jgi:hypothetical protein
MIKFQIEKLDIQHMMIKQVSSALGGMITVLDAKKSKKAKREVFTKIKIPHQLARAFKKAYTVTKYIKPVLTAVTFYDGFVVALERHPLGNLGKATTQGLFGDVEWISESENNLDKYLVPLDRTNDLFIDGTYLFTVKDVDVRGATPLSKDGRFKAVQMEAIKLQNLSLREKLLPELRTALAFTPKGKKPFLTPPIWKTLGNVGNQQFKKMDMEDVEDNTVISTDSFQFDQVDQHLSVNLGFALKAGRELSDVFGYDCIEPLGLDDLMIQMRTVNLPNIANEVKQTYDTGFPFTHAVAWLIGLVNRTNTLESYITLRTLLKHLTTKGVYRKGAFDSTAIFKDPNIVDVPLKTIEEAATIGKVDFDTFLQMGRIARTKDYDTSTGVLHDAI